MAQLTAETTQSASDAAIIADMELDCMARETVTLAQLLHADQAAIQAHVDLYKAITGGSHVRISIAFNDYRKLQGSAALSAAEVIAEGTKHAERQRLKPAFASHRDRLTGLEALNKTVTCFRALFEAAVEARTISPEWVLTVSVQLYGTDEDRSTALAFTLRDNAFQHLRDHNAMILGRCSEIEQQNLAEAVSHMNFPLLLVNDHTPKHFMTVNTIMLSEANKALDAAKRAGGITGGGGGSNKVKHLNFRPTFYEKSGKQLKSFGVSGGEYWCPVVETASGPACNVSTAESHIMSNRAQIDKMASATGEIPSLKAQLVQLTAQMTQVAAHLNQQQQQQQQQQPHTAPPAAGTPAFTRPTRGRGGRGGGGGGGGGRGRGRWNQPAGFGGGGEAGGEVENEEDF